jgi:alanyl-tRNA synthetase
MKTSEIRQAFIEFFSQRAHQAIASSSLVPGNDPSLLFTNAGMVQFKETFLGLEPRAYQRAVTAQRCVRAGGKHNDLENVGYTARHHTFFEMLGNFSFGDYFKHEAIRYAWEFLTEVLHLPPERLWITVYQDDDEAADIWLKDMGVSPARFSRCGEQDNFWSMGDTGPCGPCTEIFYDHGADIAGGPPGSPEADGDRYIEIWNLVFMQFNRDASGQLHPLPKPSVDTGMGLERIAAVVQGVHNNYDIDSFKHLISAILAKKKTIHPDDPSLKVIADHIRACSFLISDGVLPSNEGRGYVLRRIIRRAVRHGNKLGLATPFFYELVTPLIEVMGDVYPELTSMQTNIERILQQEEHQFARTLEQGLYLLREQIQGLKTKTIPGEVAFKLYDTYGFPLDLTADIAREQDLQVDFDGFQQCMQQQREQSQAASAFQVDYSHPVLDIASDFKGYEADVHLGQVLALHCEGQAVKELLPGKKATVILDDTPFYAESGGQVGDRGQLVGPEGVFQVDDTKRQGQAIIHHGTLMHGQLHVGEQLEARVDSTRRAAIRLNHTATHLLHAALKQVLGSHVQQKGSLVDAERARFDFSHSEAMSAQQLHAVEQLVNEQIRANHPVETQLMDLEEAKAAGAMALFGEKYTEKVRVLSLGSFSKELCGGTHARRTGDIGVFKILSESGIASGVRRIELLTGQYALQWLDEQLNLLNTAAQQLKTTADDLPQRLTQSLAQFKQQEKELMELKQKLAQQSGQDLLADIVQVGDVNLLVKKIDNIDVNGLRTLLDQLKSRINSAVIVLLTVSDDKMNVIAHVSKELLARINAADLVRHLCGKGGGRADMAQGGGVVPDDLEQRMQAIKTLLAK